MNKALLPHTPKTARKQAKVFPSWHHEDSRIEEIIASLWLIAALLAWSNHLKWLAWPLFVKAAFDTIAAIALGCIEVARNQSPDATSTSGVSVPANADSSAESAPNNSARRAE